VPLLDFNLNLNRNLNLNLNFNRLCVGKQALVRCALLAFAQQEHASVPDKVRPEEPLSSHARTPLGLGLGFPSHATKNHTDEEHVRAASALTDFNLNFNCKVCGLFLYMWRALHEKPDGVDDGHTNHAHMEAVLKVSVCCTRTRVHTHWP
jgi:hypothetical protein